MPTNLPPRKALPTTESAPTSTVSLLLIAGMLGLAVSAIGLSKLEPVDPTASVPIDRPASMKVGLGSE